MAITNSSLPVIISFESVGTTGYATGQTLPQTINHALIVASGGAAMVRIVDDTGVTGQLAIAKDQPTNIDGVKWNRNYVVSARNLIAGTTYTRVDFSGWADYTA
jgi:hypothetical protein